ncbi:MAG: type II toxin-antitoxin system HipA family toxin [Lachnospiraceae bacterium]|nr:type II toxin-antitoxin system HipA family toxin [Lachnospiraceae bacterium]
MKTLFVNIEICGNKTFAGTIRGNDSSDACFEYAPEYLDSDDAQPISISLPLQTGAFSSIRTRNYFEGLLPEGFLKMTVAQCMRTDESDYLSILSALGRECLGAITISEEKDAAPVPSYERLSMEQIREIAREGASWSVQLVTKAHLSLAGASGKVGLYYDEDNMSWYLPMGNAPSTHIVKQSHVRLDSIVTNEQLSLMTARKLGITVPESNIINTGTAEEGEVLFATKRYDRNIDQGNAHTIDNLMVPIRLHQEDFAQALGIAAINKYESEDGHHMRDMFDVVRKNSSNPIEDQMRLWDIITFDYLIGNTDNHIKNVSLLYGSNLKSIRLAPAYDIISTAVYESSTRELAFRIGGELNIDNVSRDSFKLAAKECGLGEKMAMARFDKMVSGFEQALIESARELDDEGFYKAYELKDRILRRELKV